MRETYLVIFTKNKNGIYLVEVPDLDCITEGKSMNDAINMARDVIGLKGIDMEDNGLKIPKASKTIAIKKGAFYGKGNSIISYVDVDFDNYRKNLNGKYSNN